MATSTAAETRIAETVTAQETSGTRAAKRRRISPQAGRALEILGHAIDYLTDEYVHSGGTFALDDPQVQAIQLLMAMNRQIYFECPEVPTLLERCRSWLGSLTA
jgi:hypothetical protein